MQYLLIYLSVFIFISVVRLLLLPIWVLYLEVHIFVSSQVISWIYLLGIADLTKCLHLPVYLLMFIYLSLYSTFLGCTFIHLIPLLLLFSDFFSLLIVYHILFYVVFSYYLSKPFPAHHFQPSSDSFTFLKPPFCHLFVTILIKQSILTYLSIDLVSLRTVPLHLSDVSSLYLSFIFLSAHNLSLTNFI